LLGAAKSDSPIVLRLLHITRSSQ